MTRKRLLFALLAFVGLALLPCAASLAERLDDLAGAVTSSTQQAMDWAQNESANQGGRANVGAGMDKMANALRAVLLEGEGAVAQSCPGDLNNDGNTSIDEIIQAVNAALYGCAQPCPCDLNENGDVSIDEIIQAVNAARSDCAPPQPTPTQVQPTATPPQSTPTATSTPVPIQSICEGAVTSVPKVCFLTPRDAGTVDNVKYLTFRFCLSDLEGDIDLVCVGVSLEGSAPATSCYSVSPGFETVNGCTETDPIAWGPCGTVNEWFVAIDVEDTAGNVSNVAVSVFNCCQ